MINSYKIKNSSSVVFEEISSYQDKQRFTVPALIFEGTYSKEEIIKKEFSRACKLLAREIEDLDKKTKPISRTEKKSLILSLNNLISLQKLLKSQQGEV